MRCSGHKRIIVNLILLTVLFLCGCYSGNNQTAVMNEHTQVESSYEFLDKENLAWEDNTMDDWQAVINVQVKELKADGEQLGGNMTCFVCEGGAVRFKNHLLGSNKTDWSGVNGVTASGEEFAKEITVGSNRGSMQIDYLGPISGKKGYVAFANEYDEEYNVTGNLFYMLDADFRKTQEISTKIPVTNNPMAIMGDAMGNVHVIYREKASDHSKYDVFSNTGERVFETYGDYVGLRMFCNGQVVACEEIITGNSVEGERIVKVDLEKKLLMEIGVLNNKIIRDETDMKEYSSFYVTAFSENGLAWCGREGLYLCDSKGENTKLAYRWSNHGIVMSQWSVLGLCATENDTIAILYRDNGGLRYALLKPTIQKKEVMSITFAVTSFDKDAYVQAAADFNRMYPAYNVEIKDDFDKTNLLTQLGAGTGPILVDTRLTGFDELEKLWQPLDGFLEMSGIADEIFPETLGFGKIGEKTYGIVSHFFIQTLVSSDSELRDWDYASFLNNVEKSEGAVFTAEWFHAPSDERAYYFNVFINGLDDNAYFDVDQDTTIFGTTEFERMLRLSSKAENCPGMENGETLRNGEALCEIVNVSGVEGLINLRAREEAGEVIIGYPTKNGARHLLSAPSPIAIRRTATDEEKKIAYTFLKVLLSYETAAASVKGNSYSKYSVRKDVLAEQFEDYAHMQAANMEYGIDITMPKVDSDKEIGFFEELLRNSAVRKYFPKDLQNVFDEEIGDYLKGNINEKVLSEHLNDRVWLYLKEIK